VARGVREGDPPLLSLLHRHVPFLPSKASFRLSVGLTELHRRLSPLIIALLISVRHDPLVVRLSVSFSYVSFLFISVTNAPSPMRGRAHKLLATVCGPQVRSNYGEILVIQRSPCLYWATALLLLSRLDSITFPFLPAFYLRRVRTCFPRT
jgi:hypothetical protein